MGERGQRRDPRRRDLGVGRDAVVGQAVPGREGAHRQVGGEEGERGAHRLHPPVVAGDMDQRPPGGLDLARQQAGVESLGRAAKKDRALGSGGVAHRP